MVVVAAAGRPRLLAFFVGLVCVIFSFAVVLEVYVYTMGLTSYGYTLLQAKEVPILFLFIGIVLLLGVFGGYEIGTYAESNKKKTPPQHVKT